MLCIQFYKQPRLENEGLVNLTGKYSLRALRSYGTRTRFDRFNAPDVFHYFTSRMQGMRMKHDPKRLLCPRNLGPLKTSDLSLGSPARNHWSTTAHPNTEINSEVEL